MRKISVLALLLFSLFPLIQVRAADGSETLFEMAQAGGAVYELATQQLVKLGDTARPLLEKEAQSAEWRRRWVAKVALARIDGAESHARWKSAQIKRRSNFVRHEGGDLVFELRGTAPDAQLTELGLESGEPIPADALVPAMDILMSGEGKDLRPEDGYTSYQILAQHGDELLFDAAIQFARSTSYPDLPFYAERIGASVLPNLHAVIRDADLKEERWRIQSAIPAIGAIGRAESTPLLLAFTERDEKSRHYRETLAALQECASADYLGALVKRIRHHLTVQAVEKSELISLGRESFFEMVRYKPDIGIKLLWQLLQVVTERLERTAESLSSTHRAFMVAGLGRLMAGSERPAVDPFQETTERPSRTSIYVLED